MGMRFLLVIFASVVFGGLLWGEEVVILPSGKVHEGDYFARGSVVEICGQVKGDVYVLASRVFIEGKVEGDLLVAAGSIAIAGDVAGSARIVAGQLDLSGHIGQSITVVAGHAHLAPTATICGNLVGVTGALESAAHVGSYATLASSSLRFSSQVEKDVRAYVGQMRLTSKACIGGDLDYHGNTPIQLDAEAQVKGKLTEHPSPFRKALDKKWVRNLRMGSQMAGLLMNFLYTVTIGLLGLQFFPEKLQRCADCLGRFPWRALAYGMLVLIITPLICLLLLMTVLGAPFALTLLALNVLGFYTAKVVTLLWMTKSWRRQKIARKLGGGENLWFVFTSLVYFFLTLVPLIGYGIQLGALLWGVGASALSWIPRKGGD